MSHIKELRLKNGFTQNKLAELIGADSNLISRWERGKAKPISLYVQKLAQIFGTSMEYILSDEPSTIVPIPQEKGVLEAEEKVKTSPPPSKERSYTEKTHALVFTDGNIRVECPTTKEGYELFREVLNKAFAGAAVPVSSVASVAQ